jgi:conjugative transfer region protein TrbK
VRARLRDRGLAAAVSSVWRFFDRHGISFKKTVHASEQERADVAAAPTVEQLLADRALLRAELERCKTLDKASADSRCKVADEAERKRFMGSRPTYTDRPVEAFHGNPKIEPQPRKQAVKPNASGSPPDE